MCASGAGCGMGPGNNPTSAGLWLDLGIASARNTGACGCGVRSAVGRSVLLALVGLATPRAYRAHRAAAGGDAMAGRRPRRHGGGLHEQKKKGEGEQGCDTPLVHDTGRGTWGWTVRWYSPSREKGAHLNFDELIVEGSDFVGDGAQQVLVGYGDVVPSASFEFSVPVKTDT